jgi:F-type H+-transporting ATPase subunit alpha
MKLNSAEISRLIQERIENIKSTSDNYLEGSIINVKDGIIKVDGLENIGYGELVELPGNVKGIALNLEKDNVGIIVCGSANHLKEGQKVRYTGQSAEVPVGYELLGRVVNALGEPIDGQGPINAKQYSAIEKIAPGVIERDPVNQSLHTGIKAIDTLVPIGKGQRELIIGDRQTGKTSLAIDTIINQKDLGVKCIYVAIGQKTSSVASLAHRLKMYDAMKNTIIVSASAAEAAAMQYLSPYSASSMGEYFRDIGEDALIIFDDLTRHAWAYRQISLLLNRPPGREAYPGDIFYLHSRLLERSSKVNKSYVSRMTNGKITDKTGSLTALPIIETQAGDITSFIPTNVISITDGQIFLETDLFNAGIRPAINAGASVSRVGSAAQTDIVKKLGGGIKLSLAQYRELEAFSQFSSDLDTITQNQLRKGERIVEIFKQTQLSPLNNAEIAISLFIIDENFLNDIPVNKIRDFEISLHKYIKNNYIECIKKINQTKKYNKQLRDYIYNIVDEFKKIYLI